MDLEFFFSLFGLVAIVVLASVLPVVLIPRSTTANETTVDTTTQTTSTTTNIPITTPPTFPAARWARTNLLPNYYTQMNSVQVGPDGNIYAVGLAPAADFDNNISFITGQRTGFIVKYNPDGIAQWVTRVIPNSSLGRSEFTGLKIASDGTIYVVGVFNLNTITYDFGNGITLTGSSNVNPILIAYNFSGIAQWARTSTTTQSASQNVFNDISLSTNNNIYVTGSISNICNFGNNVSVGELSTGTRPVLVKYNSSGIAQWAKTVPGSSGLTFSAVSVSSDENIYVSGITVNTGTPALYDFGNNVNLTAQVTGFLVKYNSMSITQWITSPISNIPYSRYFDVEVGLDDNIYVVGSINSQLFFDFGNNVNITSTNTFLSSILVKYNSSGVTQWAQTSTGGSLDQYYGLSIDINGNIYAVGVVNLEDSFDYGNGVILPAMNISNVDRRHVLIVKYNSFGVAQWAKNVITNHPGSESSFYEAANGLDGSVYAVGQFIIFVTVILVILCTSRNIAISISLNSSL